MTERERRVLRAIDEALSADDPGLAALLRGPASMSTARMLRRTAGAALGLSLVLLLLGIVLADPGVLLGAMLMLTFVPSTLWCIAAAIARYG